jgi:hypothetical protein
MGEPEKPRKRRLVLLIWLLVAVFYFYLSYDYIQASVRDGRLAEYLDHVVQLAGSEKRPAKEVRALILLKAEELGVPLRADQIEVAGVGQAINVSVVYERDIEIPVVQRVIYKKEFRHKVGYHQLR